MIADDNGIGMTAHGRPFAPRALLPIHTRLHVQIVVVVVDFVALIRMID